MILRVTHLIQVRFSYQLMCRYIYFLRSKKLSDMTSITRYLNYGPRFVSGDILSFVILFHSTTFIEGFFCFQNSVRYTFRIDSCNIHSSRENLLLHLIYILNWRVGMIFVVYCLHKFWLNFTSENQCTHTRDTDSYKNKYRINTRHVTAYNALFNDKLVLLY